MVQNNQTTRRQQSMNCLSVFDYFVGLVLKGLTFYKVSKTLNLTIFNKLLKWRTLTSNFWPISVNNITTV